ncbi:hypothetical protein ABWI01_12845 [Oceanicaulis alexandrii]|uniref:hypothetical protein n=1 Tax=Oceanicaulis alexandrii TaxID=153233 RepID=UPI0035CEA026
MTEGVMMKGALLPLELMASLGALGVEFQILEDAIDDHLEKEIPDIHQYSMGKKTKLFQRYAAISGDDTLIWASTKIDEVRLFRNKLFHAGFSGFLMSPLALYVGSDVEEAEVIQKSDMDNCFYRMHSLAVFLGWHLAKTPDAKPLCLSDLELCWDSADPAYLSRILE